MITASESRSVVVTQADVCSVDKVKLCCECKTETLFYLLGMPYRSGYQAVRNLPRLVMQCTGFQVQFTTVTTRKLTVRARASTHSYGAHAHNVQLIIPAKKKAWSPRALQLQLATVATWCVETLVSLAVSLVTSQSSTMSQVDGEDEVLTHSYPVRSSWCTCTKAVACRCVTSSLYSAAVG